MGDLKEDQSAPDLMRRGDITLASLRAPPISVKLQSLSYITQVELP